MKTVLPLLLVLALLFSLTGCPAGDDSSRGDDNTSKLTEGDIVYEKTEG